MFLLSLFQIVLPFCIFANAANTTYPDTHITNLNVHDPSVIRTGGWYYAFYGGVHIPYQKARQLSGPWQSAGTVLTKPADVSVGNSSRPWAPNVVSVNGTFYCYYASSLSGSQDSAIGVATSSSLQNGSWTDHGTIVQTGKGQPFPLNVTNAIDPAVFVNTNGKGFLNYGSYWQNIWQFKMQDDLLNISTPDDPKQSATHLAYDPETRTQYLGPNPIEGSFLSHSKMTGYYYLWYAHGRCCKWTEENVKSIPVDQV